MEIGLPWQMVMEPTLGDAEERSEEKVQVLKCSTPR